MTEEKKKEFLKKVDAFCMDCGYDGEDPCSNCPVRNVCDHLDAVSSNVDIERVKFRYNLLDDCGKTVVVKAGDIVLLVDAIPKEGETEEDVRGLCDIIDSCGNFVVRTLWINIAGLCDPC